jgi:xanthine dehydrogenase accessory factor
MYDDHIHRVEELMKRDEAFAIATVVWREMPTSGKAGDKAIVTRYGELIGWVGGGCVRTIILKEAEEALRTGKTRLVKVGQFPSSQIKEGIVEYRMTCHSEGSVDIFIEPVLPPLHLVVMGKSAIAKSVVRLGKFLGYRITAVAPDAVPSTFEKVDELITRMDLKSVRTTGRSFIVICTQGDQDEEALSEALSTPNAYVGFVASRKKKASVFDQLERAGLDRHKLDLVRSPAGLDINAKKPEEVAVSILAEVIQVHNSLPGIASNPPLPGETESSVLSRYYTNPVCGAPIDMTNPKHILEYKGDKIYFCCDGCKTKFEEDPEKYMTSPA